MIGEERIGFIGLGNMGKQFVENLLKKGYTTTVYDISKERVDLLVKEGAKLGSSVKDVTKKSDIVCISLLNHVMEEVFFGEDGIIEGIHKGQCIIDFGTTSPKTSQRFFYEAKKRGAYALDAPVSGRPDNYLAVMIGGEKEIYEKYLPIINAAGGKDVFYMGGPGCGQVGKYVCQLLIYTNRQVACEGYLLGVKFGIDPMILYETIQHTLGDSKAWRDCVKAFIKRDLGPKEGGARLSLNVEVAELLTESARELKLFTPHANLTYEILKATSAEGYDDWQNDAVFLVYEKWSKARK